VEASVTGHGNQRFQQLFRASYGICETAARIARHGDSLREAADNAAIASGHAGAQAKVFGEIARQIGLNARALRSVTERIADLTGLLSNDLLECLLIAWRREKFEGFNGPGGLRVRHALDGQILTHVAKARDSADLLGPEWDRLRQCADRSWSIAISLQVSAGAAESAESEFFLSIAGSLRTIADVVSKGIDEFEAQLSDLRVALDGARHAA
jgi:hypothetical protein